MLCHLSPRPSQGLCVLPCGWPYDAEQHSVKRNPYSLLAKYLRTKLRQSTEQRLAQKPGLCAVRSMRGAEECVRVAAERSSRWRGRARAVSTEVAPRSDLGAVPHGGGPRTLVGPEQALGRLPEPVARR